MFWLRGDLGVTAGATFTWADQSGNSRYASQSTAASQPTVTSATDYMNYNPGIKEVANQWLIIGIAWDDNTALYQRQSHLASDSVRLYLGATPLSTTLNSSNSYTFGADKSYVVMGDNAGALCGVGSNVSAKPLTVDQRPLSFI